MFKVSKPIELSKEIEIFLSNCTSYKFNTELMKSKVEKEYKTLNFVITGFWKKMNIV